MTQAGQPLICNSSVGYIDPHYFYDNASGRSYIFWKVILECFTK